ncbi:MAG: elongation factor Ts [Clostridia bacterium]|nr:elongation factor Ts [Clostridia bacterium]
MGMMECKKALTEANGDKEEAIKILREKGLAVAAKKASRIAAEGKVAIKTTADSKKAAVIEVNCETDFAAKTDKFTAFVDKLLDIVLEANPADVDALLAAKYDAENTVDDYLKKEVINSIGENISIRRFQIVEGLLSTYVHGGGTIGVIVTGETTGDEEVAKEVLKNLALQAAAMEPKYLDKDSVPAEAVEAEKEIILAQIKNDEKNANKPEAVLEKMVLGKIGKFYENNCLMEQEYVKGDKESVAKYVANTAKELKVTGFVRLAKGEGIEKKEEDYAAEVAKLAGKA